MSAKIKRMEISEVDLPFKKVFKHALHARQSSSSVFLKVCLDNGVVGFGEALPREYVTGETSSSVCDSIESNLSRLIGVSFSSLGDVVDFIERFEGVEGSCRCAMELGILDAVGKDSGESVASILGKRVSTEVFYSGVISADSKASALKDALKFKLFGFKQVKVKVGLKDDYERMKVIRRYLGQKVDIRVDANCAWEVNEAIDNITKLREFSISAVEQPVKADDIEGLKKVTSTVSETIIVDESLCSIDDALMLSKERACGMFNIRLSKCGGILNAKKIAEIARNNSIEYQLGCQVGESGVLSAAGRHFACSASDCKYLEGSYGRFLLREDVTKEDTTFRRKGRALALDGPGLGVNVLDELITKNTLKKFVVE